MLFSHTETHRERDYPCEVGASAVKWNLRATLSSENSLQFKFFLVIEHVHNARRNRRFIISVFRTGTSLTICNHCHVIEKDQKQINSLRYLNFRKKVTVIQWSCLYFITHIFYYALIKFVLFILVSIKKYTVRRS